MEALIGKLEALVTELKNYAKVKYDLTALKLFIKITNLAGSLLTGIGFLIFGTLAIFFLSAALALWLGEMMNSYALGFLCVGGLFIFIFLILFLLRRKIVFPIIRDRLIRKYYEQD
jgi:hypothetical protein